MSLRRCKQIAIERLRKAKRPPPGLTGRRYSSVLEMMRGEGMDEEMVQRVEALVREDERIDQIQRILSYAGFEF